MTLYRAKFALFNLRRNLRRSLFCGLIIAGSVAVMVLIDGFALSMYRGLEDNMIHSRLGHIQLLAPGYTDFGNLQAADLRISKAESQVLMDKLAADPEVEVVTRRLEASGMATNGQVSQASYIVGMDPDKESVISAMLRITAGRDLFADEPEGVVIGESLAKALALKPGGTLTLFTTTADDSFNAIDLQVVGLVTTGIRELDSRLVLTNLATVEGLMHTDGASRIVVLLKNRNHIDAFKSKLAADRSLPRSEVKSWRQLAPYYGEVVGLFRAIFLFVKLAVVSLAVLAVGNTLAMNVVERTREIGVLRALGEHRSEIVSLLGLEALFLGVLSVCAGVGLGLFLATGLTHSGLEMPRPPGSTVDYPLRFINTVLGCLATASIGVLATIVASILPAWRAARTGISEALHHV